MKEAILTTEFSKSEKLKNIIYLHSQNELQTRYQNLVSDIPQHLGIIFLCQHNQR